MTTKKVYITNDITAHLYGDRVTFTDSANNDCTSNIILNDVLTANDILKIAYEAIMEDFRNDIFRDAEEIEIYENDYGKPCICVSYSLKNNGFDVCHKTLNLFNKDYAETPSVELRLSNNDAIYCDYWLDELASEKNNGRYVYQLGIKFNTDFTDREFEAIYDELTFELYIQ